MGPRPARGAHGLHHRPEPRRRHPSGRALDQRPRPEEPAVPRDQDRRLVSQAGEAGRIQITHQNTTWRSSQEIATLADGVIDPTLGLPRHSVPRAGRRWPPRHLHRQDRRRREYAEATALCLRSQSNLGDDCALPYTTFGDAKGMEASHVLIWPTAAIAKHLIDRTAPDTQERLRALRRDHTRARASVAFITDRDLGLPVWTAGDKVGNG